MRITENHIIFESTGRRKMAWLGVVGLGPDGAVHGGFDQDLPALEPAEQRELAEHMIAAWTKVRDEAR